MAINEFGFGIHPDGNPPGTKGCLELQGVDIKIFGKNGGNTPLPTRISQLHVVTELQE